MSENVKAGKCVDCKYCATYKQYYDEWDEFDRQEVQIDVLCECRTSPHYNESLDERETADCPCFEAGEGPDYVTGSVYEEGE